MPLKAAPTNTKHQVVLTPDERQYLNRLPRSLRKGALERRAKQERLNSDRSKAQDKLRT